MNRRTAAMGRAVCLVASVMTFTSTSVLAQVNSWISPTSGNWTNVSSWSLGVMPGSSQSVMITNSGFKAVGIEPSTPINFPASMTVSSLTIQAASNSDNLLLLNFFGTNVPLTVLNGLTLQDNAQIEDLNSGLVVQGGTITVTNAQISQNGGFIRTMNAPMSLQDSSYNLTNGIFDGGMVTLGFPVSARFNQFGGTATITNLVFGENVMGSGGNYALYGGNLNLPGGLTMIDADNSFSSYFQAGGTNLTGNVFLEPGIFGGSPSFTLNGGLLADNNVTLEADNFGGITLTQNGGTHIITNSLSIPGAAANSTEVHPAVYQLNGGTLSAASISMDATMGTAEFNETNGIAQIGGIQGVSAPFDSFWVPEINLSGGTLTSSNIDMNDGGEINQSGGTLIVSNLLSFEGFIDPGGTVFTTFSTYTLLAGTLIANNISVGGIWIIGNSPTNRISNPGTITLSNTIVISNAVEQLGSFVLGGNAIINLAGSASQLSFANSSGQTWAGGATLAILNWNGNLSGGGAEQLKFGNNSAGLTAQQLSQIQFINPAGLAPGTYSAQILSTGEIVPAQGSSGGGLVNSWISPTSGKWTNATSWSLGILPNSSQSIMITNPGFKAVEIDSSTPINFPGSMTVSNLTIMSPTNGGNELLMNFVGAGNPLIIGSTNSPGSLLIGPNAFMVMLSSGLGVNNALGTNNSRMGEFEVDGTFIQSDGSEIVANFLDLNSTGTFNLTNGMLFVGTQFINGTFNQQGGRNLGGVDMESTNGNYQLFDGNMQGNVTLRAGTFNQWGGTNSAALITGNTGVYNLQGGILMSGDLVVGSPPQNGSQIAGGGIEQSGGTNIAGNMSMVFGFYNLSNGTLSASSLTLTTNTLLGAIHAAEFNQYGGFNTNGVLNIIGGANPFPVDAFYFLYGGTLQTPSINMNLGEFVLRDATNRVATLSLINHSIYQMDSGLLAVDQIQVTEAGTGDSEFWHSGGSLTGARNLTLANGQWIELSTGAQFGQLQLGSGTNSALTFQTIAASCIFSFANSSSVPWASDGILAIRGWRGSPGGGGTNQVLFGTTASGLTAQQLSQVQFSNPAGLAPGTYSSRILSTGEVVPNQLIGARASVTFSEQGNNLILTWPTGWTLQSATNVLGTYSDVSGATSPFTNNETLAPQKFFRLRH